MSDEFVSPQAIFYGTWKQRCEFYRLLGSEYRPPMVQPRAVRPVQLINGSLKGRAKPVTLAEFDAACRAIHG